MDESNFGFHILSLFCMTCLWRHSIWKCVTFSTMLHLIECFASKVTMLSHILHPLPFWNTYPRSLRSVLLKSFYKNKSYQSFLLIISKTLLAKLNIFNTMATWSVLWLMYPVSHQCSDLINYCCAGIGYKEERDNKSDAVNNHSTHTFWSFLRGDQFNRFVFMDQLPSPLRHQRALSKCYYCLAWERV